MERTGIRDPEKAYAYIGDALLEIQMLANEQVKRYVMDVEDGVRYYTLPSDMVTLKGVYRLYDDSGNYVKIPYVQNIDLLEDASSSDATSDDDIIVI